MANQVKIALDSIMRLASNVKNFAVGLRITKSGITWSNNWMRGAQEEGTSPQAVHNSVYHPEKKSFASKFFIYITSRSFIKALTIVCAMTSLITASIASFGTPVIIAAAASLISIAYGTVLECRRTARLTDLREKTLFITKLKEKLGENSSSAITADSLKASYPPKGNTTDNLLIQKPVEPTVKRNFLYWLKYYAESLSAAVFSIPVAMANPIQTGLVISSATISLLTTGNSVHTRRKVEFSYKEAFYIEQQKSLQGIDLNAAFQNQELRSELGLAPIKTTIQKTIHAAKMLLDPFTEDLSDISRAERLHALEGIGVFTKNINNLGKLRDENGRDVSISLEIENPKALKAAPENRRRERKKQAAKASATLPGSRTEGAMTVVSNEGEHFLSKGD